MNDIAEVGVGNALARQHDDKGAVAVSVDIGRSVAEPINVVVHYLKNLCRVWNAWGGARAPDEAAGSAFIVAVGAASRVLSSRWHSRLAGIQTVMFDQLLQQTHGRLQT